MKFSETKYGDLSNQEIYGEIRVKDIGLTSLFGCPKIVKEYFTCGGNNLTSLKGRPKEIRGDFYCGGNNLISLQGRPKKIEGYFDCTKNPNLKDVKTLIVKNRIVAKRYYTDEGVFYYPEIRTLIEKEIKIEKEKIKKISKIDFGLGI